MAKWIGFLTLIATTLFVWTYRAGAEDEVKRKVRLECEALFKKLDSNSDGKLSRDEFLRMADRAKDKERAKIRDRLAKVYDRLDPERKGLTKDQFKTFLEARKNGEN
jgi:hypothetical protein